MSQGLSKDVAYRALGQFFNRNPFVLFGTGTSCALDTCFGMDALKGHLLSNIPKIPLTSEQRTQWDTVADSLDEGADLESAMDSVKDEDLTKRIISCTAELIVARDREYGVKILTGEVTWPAWPLFKRLLGCLHATNRALHVATPNYDLLAEYAFEKAGIPYLTGYTGGICRSWDWVQAERAVTYLDSIPYGKRVKKSPKSNNHIRLYKVHGSLNTFRLNNAIVENNAWIYAVPDGVDRMMITPGTSKYERLHQNRQELLGPYDSAIEKHNAFLFVGFGFNDNQLNNDAIKRKLKDPKCHGLIITRDSNERIDNLLRDCKNLWLVCKPRDTENHATKISNSRYPNELYLKDKCLWDAGEFSKEILGG